MPALIQFVDSIGSSPTVRLDINDGAAWFCTNFSAPPPRLRRSESSNSMRDGGIVGSSSYENRTLTIDLTLVNASTEDAAATAMQALWRELDRPVNYLRYQREGMTKPVFFRVFRSDASNLEELWTTPVARNITIELLAEPFALGLPESLGPYVLNGGTGDRFTIPASSALGDVATPLVITHAGDGTNLRGGAILGIRSERTSSLTTLGQCESMTLLTNTANPGGGPDSAMSGTGTNNYVTTSFATATMQTRLRWDLPTTTDALSCTAGRYIVAVVVRASDNLTTFRLRATAGLRSTETVTVSSSVSRWVELLGVLDLTAPIDRVGGYASALGVLQAPQIELQAERVSGSGTLQWDQVRLIPADSAALRWTYGGAATNNNLAYDSWNEAVYAVSDTTSALLSATVSATFPPSGLAVTGGFIYLSPSVDNVICITPHAAGAAVVVGRQDTFRVFYYPRYLFVRPVST